MTNETNDRGTRDAAAILAELMDAVDALAESWRGEADTYLDRRQFAAADAIGTAALQASDTVAALRTRVAAGQTRQAPRDVARALMEQTVQQIQAWMDAERLAGDWQSEINQEKRKW